MKSLKGILICLILALSAESAQAICADQFEEVLKTPKVFAIYRVIDSQTGEVQFCSEVDDSMTDEGKVEKSRKGLRGFVSGLLSRPSEEQPARYSYKKLGELKDFQLSENISISRGYAAPRAAVELKSYLQAIGHSSSEVGRQFYLMAAIQEFESIDISNGTRLYTGSLNLNSRRESFYSFDEVSVEDYIAEVMAIILESKGMVEKISKPHGGLSESLGIPAFVCPELYEGKSLNELQFQVTDEDLAMATSFEDIDEIIVCPRSEEIRGGIMFMNLEVAEQE